MNWAASLFASVIEALSRRSGGQRSSLATVGRSILRYPLKTIAAFLMAPILAFGVACVANDPIRRVIAGVGLVLAVVVAWVVLVWTGKLLVQFLGILGIVGWLGPWDAIVFLLFGSIVVVPVGIVLAAVALNATAWFFLHMSSEEVVEYLRSLSE